MKTIFRRLNTVVVLFGTACIFGALQQCIASMLPNPAPDRAPVIHATRRAGLTGDRSKIPLMIETLRQQNLFEELSVALHSLAQLGATEALPDIDAMMQREGSDRELYNFARVSRARLVAEAKARGRADPVEAANIRVQTFYRETGLAPTQINGVTAEFNRVPMVGPGGLGTPMEVYAMRELADMLYLGPYTAYVNVPGIASIQFALDNPSMLKARLARLSHEERVKWLVPDLANQQVVAFDQAYEQQMTADEGLLASRATGEQLRKMEVHREEYSRAGFNALFGVLSQIRDPALAWVWPHFANDPDQEIVEYAHHHSDTRYVELPFVFGY